MRDPEVNDELGGLMCVLILLDDREGVRLSAILSMSSSSLEVRNRVVC